MQQGAPEGNAHTSNKKSFKYTGRVPSGSDFEPSLYASLGSSFTRRLFSSRLHPRVSGLGFRGQLRFLTLQRNTLRVLSHQRWRMGLGCRDSGLSALQSLLKKSYSLNLGKWFLKARNLNCWAIKLHSVILDAYRPILKP